jgi:type II secretory pathway pseudopilin PulG
MEIFVLIISGLAMLAGVASAIVAIQQAVKASKAEKRAIAAQASSEAARDESAALAKKATSAFIRQAEALEENNRLKREEMEPAPWTTKHVNNDLYAAFNSSGRDIVVDRVEVKPDTAVGRVRLSLADDGRYAYGDSVEFIVSQALGSRAKKISIYWRFEDEPDAELSVFIIPL